MRRIAMKVRGPLVKAHRWLSFVLLAWLVVISLTGVVLVLDDHLDHWLNPELFTHGAADKGPDAAIAAAKEVMPEDAPVEGVVMPANASGVYFVEFEVPQPGAPAPKGDAEPEMDYPRVYVDPSTLEVNGVRKPYDEGFTWWMYRGHMYLWQDQGLFGVDAPDGWCAEPSGWFNRAGCTLIPEATDTTAWFGVGWMVVLLTGFYLWYWPGVKRWARAVRVRTGRGAFTFNLDLHKAFGIVMLVPLLIVTFTGIAFGFPLLKNVFQRVTPAEAKFELWVPPDSGAVSAKAPKDAEPIGFDEATEVVRAAHPHWRIDSAWSPEDETGVYAFWVDKGFSTWTGEAGGGNTLIHVDQYTGKVRYTGSPEEGNVFDQAWDDWSFPLHTGDVFGEPSRILWVFVALAPLVLGGTGLVMNRIRVRKRKRRAAATGEAEADLRQPVETDVDLVGAGRS